MHDVQVALRMSRSVAPPLALAVAHTFTFVLHNLYRGCKVTVQCMEKINHHGLSENVTSHVTIAHRKPTKWPTATPNGLKDCRRVASGNNAKDVVTCLQIGYAPDSQRARRWNKHCMQAAECPVEC